MFKVLSLSFVLVIISGCSSRVPVSLGTVTVSKDGSISGSQRREKQQTLANVPVPKDGSISGVTAADAPLEPSANMDPILRDAAETTISCLSVRAAGEDRFKKFLQDNAVTASQMASYLSWFREMYQGCKALVDQELAGLKSR